MKNQTENELLSAYLDGELTAAERARVEQLLAGNPAARQLLDELRAIGSTLQSLPRQKLGEDLSERVLQDAAKRKMSGIDGSQPASQLAQSSATPPSKSGRSRLHPLGRQLVERIKNNPRLVVWPALVVTVAVLLTVFNPTQRGGDANSNIARTPTGGNGGKNADNDDRAVGATLLVPKEGELVKTEDQPSISAVKSPEVARINTHLVPKGAPSGDKTQNPPAANARNGLIVVQCQMSRESLKQRDYRKVFDANNVALPDKSAAETLQTTPSDLAEATGIERAVLEDIRNPADADVKAKVLALVLTPTQFTGLLDGLYADRGTFRAVSVKPVQLQQPSPSAAPPSASKTAPTKRVLFVFRVVDAASRTKVQQSDQ